MKYHLSNRQAKELASGRTLRIALPHPPGEVRDYAMWFRVHLDLPPGAVVWDADATRCTVLPIAAGDGLVRVLGEFVRATPVPTELWTIEIECVVAYVAMRRAQRGKPATQWPGWVTLDDGRRIPDKGD